MAYWCKARISSHVNHLKAVLAISNEKLFANAGKCFFFVPRLYFWVMKFPLRGSNQIRQKLQLVNIGHHHPHYFRCELFIV